MISARNCDDVFLQRNRLVFILYLFLEIPYKIMKTNIQKNDMKYITLNSGIEYKFKPMISSYKIKV